MKRLFALLFLVALCSCQVCAAAPQDVPSDHWAYEAVTSLLDKGYMLGYPDGSFMGNRTLTRYEFATIVMRLMDGMAEMAAKQVSQPAPTTTSPTEPAKPQVTREDMATLQKLVDEFKAELAVIGARIDKVEAALGALTTSVDTINSILTDEEGQLQTLRSDVSKLKKVSVSGYVQARYNVFGGDPNSASSATPPNSFSVRRARIKVAGKPTDKSLVVLQLDGGQGYTATSGPSVSTKDAYLQYDFAGDPALGPSWLMGQLKWPFGYEVVQSSAVRESPERALIIQRFFPGERDRGSYISMPFKRGQITWRFGAFNGVQTSQTPPTDAKAMVSSLRGSFGDLDVGISGWYGGRVMDKAGAWYYKVTEPKKRFGADLEYYMSDLALKAEYLRGSGVDGADSTKPYSTDPVSKTVDGFWAQAAWNFTRANTLAVRYQSMSLDPLYPKLGRRSAWDIGLLRWLDEKTRVKLYYIINQEEKQSFKNNAFIGEWITTF